MPASFVVLGEVDLGGGVDTDTSKVDFAVLFDTRGRGDRCELGCLLLASVLDEFVPAVCIVMTFSGFAAVALRQWYQ